MRMDPAAASRLAALRKRLGRLSFFSAAFNCQLFHPFSQSELLSNPTRLSSATGPCFSMIVGIAKLGPYRRIRAAALGGVRLIIELVKALFEHALLGGYSCAQHRTNLFVQGPQFLSRHFLEYEIIHYEWLIDWN
jgi:hypothetical protein